MKAGPNCAGHAEPFEHGFPLHQNADFLRYGAFRRVWLRRIFLGTAFVLPVYRHKRLSDVRLDAKFLARWKAAWGESVLDFGCGQGDEAGCSGMRASG